MVRGLFRHQPAHPFNPKPLIYTLPIYTLPI